jgi:hypothetical protein
MLHCRLAGWLEMGTWTGFVGCLTGRETCVVDATVHCSAAQIAPRYALGAYTVARLAGGRSSHVFPRGNDCSGAGRAALASLMWNGVDTTWRATMPGLGGRQARHRVVQPDPAALILVLPEWLILLWIAAVLASCEISALAQH